MAMTPAEMVVFFSASGARSRANISRDQIRSSPLLLELNYRHWHQGNLMAALVAWRHSLHDPRPALELAFEAACSALFSLADHDSPTPLPERFRFYDVAHLALLVGKPVPERFTSVLRLCCEAPNPDTHLDYLLADFLVTGRDALTASVSEEPPSSRYHLWFDTFRLYARLLQGESDALAKTEVCFARRARDGYFSGGLGIEGGGADNKFTVDYRLAAILKRTGLAFASIHALPLEKEKE
jgi:hypothetical protein